MSIKLVFLGGAGVGKTSIIKCYTQGSIDQMHHSTVSASYVEHRTVHEGKAIDLGIWDTAGAEQYRSIAPMYFRNAHVALVVADAGNSDSDADAAYWATKLKEAADRTVVIVVMNKIDLVDDVKSAEARADALSAKHGGNFYMTSALKKIGILELFAFALDLIPDVISAIEIEPRASDEPALQERPMEKSRCC
jgi:Ras-related protein Rab-5C